MAAYINTKNVVLQDNWPGIPNFNLGIPTGGFDSTLHCCSVQSYPIGTKIQGYSTLSGLEGPYTMIYLRYYCLSSANAVEDISGNWAIFQAFCNSTCISADGTNAVFTCTNKGGIDTGYKCGTTLGLIGVACSTLSSFDNTIEGQNEGGYGWFWCGGVCPIEDITMYDAKSAYAGSDMTSGGNMAAGDFIYPQVDTSVLQFDGAADGSVNVCGWSIEADT